MTPEEKLQEMGLEIPEVAEPVAAYVPGVKADGLLHISGQIPFVDGELEYTGKVESEVSVDEAYEAARICCLNGIGVIKSELGELCRVKRIVKISGYVNSDPEFTGQSQVVNGASDLLGEVFGEAGSHARAAVGMASLPLGAAVEVEFLVQFD